MKMRAMIRAKFRVKINSLAAEARIIRREEGKMTPWKGEDCENGFTAMRRESDRGCLTWHRTSVVRDEARKTQLAYAFLRGVPYSVVERNGSKPVPHAEVWRIVQSLGDYDFGKDALEVVKWVEAVPELVPA